jgi:N-acetylglucosaminyldiphosphoundecaprenol N-acetyl-beta-D-mannosaminyltransferase
MNGFKTNRRHLMKPEPRANILGVGISAISMTQAVGQTFAFLETRRKAYICVTGVHGIMEAQIDEEFRSILNSSFLTTPDGMPTVWLGRHLGFDKMTRVYGPELMLELCAASIEKGYRHFLYGGKPGVAEDLERNLSARFAGIQIAGSYTPPFRPLIPEEELELERLLHHGQVDILWCGLSTPKQERFMAKYIGRLPVKLMVGVGAAFDINSGHLRDAPQWMKRSGLQWLFRMIAEPRRLAGRYLRNNPRFLWLICLQLLGLRKYSLMTIMSEKNEVLN